MQKIAFLSLGAHLSCLIAQFVGKLPVNRKKNAHNLACITEEIWMVMQVKIDKMYKIDELK